MGLRLLSSPHADQRFAAARAWLLAKKPDCERLVIGPSSHSTADLLRRIALGQPALFGWHRHTLASLAAEIAMPVLAERGLSTVGLIGAEAMVIRVIHEHRDKLTRFASIVDSPGFGRAMTRTIRELSLEGLDQATIATTDPQLALVFDGYQKRLEQAGLTDRAGLLRVAIEAASVARGQHYLLGLSTLLADVAVENLLERQWLAALVGAAPDVLATIPHGDERTLAHLEAALGNKVTAADTDETSKPADNCLRRLQRQLFSDSANIQAEADETVGVLSAPGESRECVEIARQILRHAEAGTPFDAMGVLLRAPSQYQRHLEMALARASIPAYFEKGVVRPDPAGRAFLSLLRCAVDGLSARRFSEYLSLGELPDLDAQGQPPDATPEADRWVPPDTEAVPRRLSETIDTLRGNAEAQASTTLRTPRRWERLLVEAAVIGGLDRWRRRLDGLAEQLQIALDRSTADEADAAVIERLRRDQNDLRALRELALPLLEDLQQLPSTNTWGGWAERLGDLASRSLREPQRVLTLLGELTPMASVGPASLQEVLRVLEDHLLELRRPPTAQRYGKLYVGSIEAARSLCLDVVFIPGMAERLFPQKIAQDPMLLDAKRLELDGGLLTNPQRIGLERRALHVAVGAASQRVVFSYPRVDLDQSRPRVPSFYALESIRAAEGRLPLFEDLAARAETVADAHIGWPAPQDPQVAIDEAEYDLALLRPLAELPEEETLGRGQYLLSSNVHLGRALRFRARRWLRRWTPADGLVIDSGTARAALDQHGLDKRSFSPTALQHLAECPYKFYLRTILKLAPREEAQAIDELDPLQRGSLVHDVQFELLSELERQRLLPVTAANLQRCRGLMEDTLTQVAADYRERLAPAIETVWQDGIGHIGADLREWLQQLSQDPSGYVPWRFELAFGLAGRDQADPHSVATPVTIDGGLQLRGSIDLVERKADGDTISLRVTDHKTGKVAVRGGAIIEGGKSLQPVLYPLAAEQLVPEAAVASGRLSYCTTRGGFSEHEVPLDQDARDAAKLVAKTVDGLIESGFLPAFPTPRTCQWCDYRSVCGPHEELRASRKPSDDRLADLRTLRDHP